mgnify:FL=1
MATIKMVIRKSSIIRKVNFLVLILECLVIVRVINGDIFYKGLSEEEASKLNRLLNKVKENLKDE